MLDGFCKTQRWFRCFFQHHPQPFLRDTGAGKYLLVLSPTGGQLETFVWLQSLSEAEKTWENLTNHIWTILDTGILNVPYQGQVFPIKESSPNLG